MTTDGRDGGPLTASALIRGVVDCFSVPVAGGSVAACGCFLVVYPAAVGAPSTKSAVAMFLAVIRCCVLVATPSTSPGQRHCASPGASVL